MPESSLTTEEIAELKLLAAQAELGLLTEVEILEFASRATDREMEDPEAMDILCERHPKLADVAPHLRRWARRHDVAPKDRSDAAFTLAADTARRFLAGSLDWSDVGRAMYRLDFLGECEFRAGDLFWLAEFKSRAGVDMTDEEITEVFRTLTQRLLDFYDRNDLAGWNSEVLHKESERRLRPKGSQV